MGLPRLRYLLAQAVILLVWAQDWCTGVAGVFPDRILMPEALTISVLGLPPALAVGVAHGRGEVWQGGPQGWTGAAFLSTVLVVGLAVWVSAAGVLSLHLDLAAGTREPPVMVRFFVLFVVEVIFVVEVLAALFTSRYLSKSR